MTIGGTLTSLSDDELAVMNAFGDDEISTPARVISCAGKERPDTRVRVAYWSLVTRGALILLGSGKVKRVLQLGQ